MTMPRQITAGRTYLITRRCRDRRFLLRPDATINQIFWYCLASAAAKTGVLVHAVVVMSNHFHIVVTDPNGVLPKFYHRLCRFTASAVNAHRRRTGSVYEAGDKVSVVWLASEEAIIDKLAYVIANPVAAALVRESEHWPGVITRPSDLLGRTMTIERPRVYFRRRHETQLALELCAPPCFEGREGWLADAVAQRVEDIRQDIALELSRCHRSVLGAAAVKSTSWNAKPSGSSEPSYRRPTFAGITADVLRACGAQARAFHAAYRHALLAWRTGQRDTEFPPGTWWMVAHHGARVAA